MFAWFWMHLTRGIYNKQLLQVKNRYLKLQRSFRSIYLELKDNQNNIDKYMKTGKSITWRDARSSVVTKHLRDRTASHPLSRLVQAQGFHLTLKRAAVVFSDTKGLTAIFNPRSTEGRQNSVIIVCLVRQVHNAVAMSMKKNNLLTTQQRTNSMVYRASRHKRK